VIIFFSTNNYPNICTTYVVLRHVSLPKVLSIVSAHLKPHIVGKIEGQRQAQVPLVRSSSKITIRLINIIVKTTSGNEEIDSNESGVGIQEIFLFVAPSSRVYEVKDETWSSTTFLILASISGVMFPFEISSSRVACAADKWERNSLSHLVIWSTGMESRRPLTPA